MIKSFSRTCVLSVCACFRKIVNAEGNKYFERERYESDVSRWQWRKTKIVETK